MALNHTERSAIKAADLSWILPRLRASGALWHRTSVESLASILASGAIEPNKGQFKFTYPQSESSYSARYGAVSLFDFDTAPVERVLEWRDCWEGFLTDRGVATVLIEINRAAFDPAKLRNSDYISALRHPLPDGRGAPVVIPFVEVCHDEAIPVIAFRCYLIVRGAPRQHGLPLLLLHPAFRPASPQRIRRYYVTVDCGAGALSRIQALERKWKNQNG